MTKRQRELLDQLIAVAGSSDLVQEALRSLNEERREAPDLREVVRRILELRQKREEDAAVLASK
jgi:hypothetical protein